jgi:hypothetical protein
MTNTNLRTEILDSGEAIKTLVLAILFLLAGMAIATSCR